MTKLPDAVAIDLHVHPGTQAYVDTHGEAHEKIENFFGASKTWTEPELAEYYVKHKTLGVLLAFDAETATGAPATTNDYVARVVREYPEAFVCGFASVDPWKGKMAVRELRRAVEELGLQGLKLHPPVQEFDPSDARFAQLWETAEEYELPVLIHTGITGWPDVPTKFAKPIPALDDLALRYEGVTIIAAHPSFPWVDEQIALALTRRNVYVEWSGYAPKYLPDRLVYEANHRLADKTLFGTDFPGMKPDRWLSEFADLPLKDEVRGKILKDNAVRVLGLGA